MLARVPSAGRLIEAHPAEQTDAAHAPRAAPQRSPNARNARRPAGQRPQPAEEVSQRRASPAKSRLSTQNLGWVSPTGRRISVVDWEDPWSPEPGAAWRLDAPVASQNEAKQPTARALMLSDTAGR